MKPLFAVTLLVVCPSLAAAGTLDEAIVAAMKLSEYPNYSWTSVVSDDAQTYTIDGKTQIGGYTWARLPVPRSLARRTGRNVDPVVEAFFRAGHAVLRTDEGWKEVSELPRCHRDWRDDDELIVRGAGAPSIWNPVDPLGMPPPAPTLLLHRGKRASRYSNLQFAVSPPHEELAVIVCSHTSLRVDDSTISGELTDMGARLLLVREGEDRPDPVAAAGAFELTINDGMVVKYQLRLEGILQIERKRIHVRQFSRTTIRLAGATHVDVPAEVRFKFGD